MTNTIKIGVMPGRIEEFVLTPETTVQQALEIANLSTEGFELKVDGATVTDLNQTVGNANVILLTKRVKGNGTVKIGVMPGRINEFALTPETTVAEALALAELSTDGFEVKIDGTTVSDFNQTIGSANVVLLTKKIKGNK